MKAARRRIELRISNRAYEGARITGLDFDRNHKQLVKEQRAAERDGLISTDTALSDQDSVDGQEALEDDA